MLKKPSGLVPPFAVGVRPPMEVESTRVQTLPDGKKMIDVTMRRAPPAAEKLVVPQFDDESSSSSSGDDDHDHDDERAVRRRPQQDAPPVDKTRRDERDHDGENNAPEARASFHGGTFEWSGVQDIQSLTHANAALQDHVGELKQQLHTLQIQLEAMAPVPGFNAAVVQDILLDKDGTEHDIRDAKIVHQAKTLRHLKRSMQRDKQAAVDAVKQCRALEQHAAQLEKENETLTLKLARVQARTAAAARPEEDPQAAAASEAVSAAKDRDSVGAWKKKFEDMRIRHDKLAADLKKTQRALVKEVGEDVSLEEIVEGNAGGSDAANKRGRAQQIIMLKAKVKKLEGELAKATSSAGGGGDPPTSSSKTSIQDVDQRAQQDLSGQHTQKQRVLDKLTAERDELLDRLHHVTKKFDALRSRTQILEKEKQDHKAKLQLLVDKSRNDDALVDALQRQLETWKGKLQEAKRARTAESSSAGSGGGGGGNGLPKDERLELDRLRALVADYKRQQPLNQSTSSSCASNGFMPPPSEAAQYRAITVEKERLSEQVRALQSQLEDKERQIRTLKAGGGEPSAVAAVHPLQSRIPRLVPGSLPASQYFPAPPAADVAVETLRKSFRDAMASKEQEIESLKQQLQRLTQQQSPASYVSSDAVTAQQEIQDLQEENEYLRQEFERLKTRYEAVVKSSRATKSTG